MTNNPIPIIPCQELLKKQDVFCGWLRRRTVFHKCGEKIDRKLTRTHIKAITKFIPWERRYVVLNDGFVFIYDNETSKKPLKIFDLIGVERAELLNIKEVPWPFKVISILNMKDMLFGATSEIDQQKWIDAVKKEIGVAAASGRELFTPEQTPEPETVPQPRLTRNKSLPIPVEDDDDEDLYDYDELEDFEPATDSKSESGSSSSFEKRHLPLPEIPQNSRPFDDDSDNGEQLYEEVDLSPRSPTTANDRGPNIVPRSALPVPKPAETSTTAVTLKSQKPSTAPKVPLPPVQKKPPVPNPTAGKPPVPAGKPPATSNGTAVKKLVSPVGQKVLPRREIDFEDVVEYEVETDIVKLATWIGTGDGVETLKSTKEEGVFMIRPSTSGNDENTIQVVTTDGVLRKYKITKEGSKYKISGMLFATMKELIDYFQKNSLPTCSTKLTKPYKTVTRQ